MSCSNITWKPIVGYSHLYEISSCGDVRRVLYKGKKVQMPLTPKIHKEGYYCIALRDYEAGTRKWFLIHRLIALAFIPNPENKCDVNHKNGIKTDNSIDNLEWATRKENIIHSWATGLSKPNSGCYKKGNYPARWL